MRDRPADSVPRRVLIDTDTKNEIDDQYAIVRALLAPELEVEGITAAGFYDLNRTPRTTYIDGAERSYKEILELLDLMDLTDRIPAALGSTFPMTDKHTPKPSAATELIVERALAREDEPLYVLGLGQFTNLASALLTAPEIKERVVYACIDGDYRHGRTPVWGPGLYNWINDVPAVQAIFESDVRYIHMPARSVSGKMKLTLEEARRRLRGRGGVYDYLIDIWETPPFDAPRRTLWDIALVHVMIDPGHGIPVDAPAPVVHDDGSTTDWPENPRRMTVYADIDPDEIFASFWRAVDDAVPKRTEWNAH